MTLNSLAVRNNLVLSLLWHLKIFRSTSTQNIFVGLARNKQVSHSRTGRPATYSVMLVATKSTSFWTNLLPQFTQNTSWRNVPSSTKSAMCHLDPIGSISLSPCITSTGQLMAGSFPRLSKGSGSVWNSSGCCWKTMGPSLRRFFL